YTWIAMLVLIVISLFARATMSLVPRGVYNAIETCIEALLQLVEDNIGAEMGRFFFPFLATLFLFILVGNFLGLIPGFEAPTGNINTTAAWATPVFFATHIFGFKKHGIGYMKQFFGPVRSLIALPLMILMFFVEVLGHLARPVTLAVRLFGNMLAKHMLLLILGMLAPWIVPSTIIGLGVLVSIVQAFVFVLLSILYLAAAVEESHL
ncbi:MAG: ATP synthase F0 subunit A, partial [Nitrospirae bacterium]